MDAALVLTHAPQYVQRDTSSRGLQVLSASAPSGCCPWLVPGYGVDKCPESCNVLILEGVFGQDSMQIVHPVYRRSSVFGLQC